MRVLTGLALPAGSRRSQDDYSRPPRHIDSAGGALPEEAAAPSGPEFEAWFIKSDLGISFLFRLAAETGVVLLPGNGFEVVDTSARISLANLTDIEYAAIGKLTRKVLDEYYDDFKAVVAAPAESENNSVSRSYGITE